jgi:hypothetical protein
MMMASLEHAARALGGEVSGGRIRCPGPGHAPHDRSMWVKFDRSPNGFTVGTFSSRDDWQVCKDYVRARLGLASFQPAKRRLADEDKAVQRRAEGTLTQTGVKVACAEERIRYSFSFGVLPPNYETP